jgi:hypothetical protein
MKITAVPSAWFLQAWECHWRWRAGERSDGWDRGLGAPVEVLKDLLDRDRIFTACPEPVFPIVLSLSKEGLALTFTAPPQYSQVSILNTRFNRCA